MTKMDASRMPASAPNMVTSSQCPGCGAVLPELDGPTHPYLGCSPACWGLYGEVLAREYGDPAYFGVHQLTVDAYAAQHPGTPQRRSIQSVALHLITLCLTIEGRAKPGDGPQLHRRLAKRHAFQWLEPPQPLGAITVADVQRATDAMAHKQRVERWAHDVWTAWAPHHATIRRWIRESLDTA